MEDFRKEKQYVRDFMEIFDRSGVSEISDILTRHTCDDYRWRGMHPFYEKSSIESVVQDFWLPLRASLTSLQRREDIFFAGQNIYNETPQVWTCSMGHFMGLFDKDWLGIPATQKIVFLPYAEFHRIKNGKIAESTIYVDIIKIMQQAGLDPIPTQTATAIIQPGPKTHDGIQLGCSDPKETQATLDLLEKMISDLSNLNVTGNDRCGPELLQKTWHDDMTWYGPGGIGAAYTIPRYQEQHQYPFGEGLTDKKFLGHVTRFAEGNYAGWFGWPNLTNRNCGGFLGLPESEIEAEMRVVDIYRRDKNKLSENWVFIDILYYLFQHGIDLLKNPNALKY